MKPSRIGSGAVFAGDRIEPAQALAEHGALDALVFERLAERTIALARLRPAARSAAEPFWSPAVDQGSMR